jgi:hypothetical protein
MKYAEHVKNNFGEDHIFEVGARAVTTRDVSSMTYCIKKDTVVTITDIGARGYDLVDDAGHEVIECRWDCVAPLVRSEAI